MRKLLTRAGVFTIWCRRLLYTLSWIVASNPRAIEIVSRSRARATAGIHDLPKTLLWAGKEACTILAEARRLGSSIVVAGEILPLAGWVETRRRRAISIAVVDD